MSSGPFLSDGEVQKPALTTGTTFDKNFKEKFKTFETNMGIALVDLTDGLPQYAVNRQEDVEKHVFSLAKIGPLLAAFRLRERLRNEYTRAPAEDAADLVAKIEKAWRPPIKSKAANLGFDDFPNLKKIFSLPNDGGYERGFDFRGPASEWEALMDLERGKKDSGGAIPKSIIDNLGFIDRMKLMIRMSDNNAAGSVISDLGLSFIYGTLVNEGFYSPGKHGLWISNTYGYDSKFAGFEANGDDITAGATARSVALFMTLAYQQKLLRDSQASQELLDILEELPHIGTLSTFTRAGGLSKGDVAYSKLGLDIFDRGHDSRASEGAVIERVMKTKKGHPKQLKYVAVGLQAAHMGIMPKLIRKIDDYVQEVHDP